MAGTLAPIRALFFWSEGAAALRLVDAGPHLRAPSGNGYQLRLLRPSLALRRLARGQARVSVWHGVLRIWQGDTLQAVEPAHAGPRARALTAAELRYLAAWLHQQGLRWNTLHEADL
ncbi:hypothetical protein L493_0185 [Bordetella bronchiseptica 99-R-0433]|uniref:hypothetical protein n=1 Tax=Bordetella bronchiseptica TaxID=518 RepID=UPI00045A0A0C|nr:hypothetical protein [Bordetella bronchiseptica]KCV59690.1 hypothetical protein L493_0185 [Bordetella bronchiseptica 99-R-0433]